MSTRSPEPGSDDVYDEVTNVRPRVPADAVPTEEHTRVMRTDEVDEPTQAFYRDEQPQHTSVLPAAEPAEPARPSAAELAAAERRRARDESLGRRRPVEDDAPVGDDLEERPLLKARPTTDKFLPALGLFLVRIATGAAFALHGLDKLTRQSFYADQFSSLGLPQPHWVALGMGIVELLIGVALVLGFAVRLAGLGLAIIGISALVLVHWRSWPLEGFRLIEGEAPLLYAGLGVIFLVLGGGLWGVDGVLRKAFRRDKGEAVEYI